MARRRLSWNSPNFRRGAHTGNWGQGSKTASEPATSPPEKTEACEGCGQEEQPLYVCQTCSKTWCPSCWPWGQDCPECKGEET